MGASCVGWTNGVLFASPTNLFVFVKVLCPLRERVVLLIYHNGVCQYDKDDVRKEGQDVQYGESLNARALCFPHASAIRPAAVPLTNVRVGGRVRLFAYLGVGLHCLVYSGCIGARFFEVLVVHFGCMFLCFPFVSYL